MKVFNVKDNVIGVLFPVNKKTGEVLYTYEALQVMRYDGKGLFSVTVDGVTHNLSTGCFVYGLVIHPDSDVEVHSSSAGTLYCQPVDHPRPVLSQESLVVEQPKTEVDAYDAFLQAQKRVHTDLYAMDIDPEDDEDLDSESILSDYDEDEIPTPYELSTDPVADSIVDRIKRAFVPAGPPEPSETGSDVPPTKSKEEAPPKE